MAQAVSRRRVIRGGLGSTPRRSMWDLWQTEWKRGHWIGKYVCFVLKVFKELVCGSSCGVFTRLFIV